jgi:hypothetical protein
VNRIQIVFYYLGDALAAHVLATTTYQRTCATEKPSEKPNTGASEHLRCFPFRCNGLSGRFLVEPCESAHSNAHFSE